MGLEEAEDAQAAVVCVMAAPFMSMPCVFCEQAAPSVACDMHTSHADIIPLRSTGRLERQNEPARASQALDVLVSVIQS